MFVSKCTTVSCVSFNPVEYNAYLTPTNGQKLNKYYRLKVDQFMLKNFKFLDAIQPISMILDR